MLSANEKRLIHGYLDGTLDEAEWKQLKVLLHANTQARTMLRELATVDAGIHGLAAADPTIMNLWANPSLVAAATNSRGRSRWLAPIASSALAAVAAALLVFVLQPAFQQGNPMITSSMPAAPMNYVATAHVSRDCRWTDGSTAISEGERLSPGTLSLAAGLVEVVFDDGATLIAEGPVKLRIESARAAYLLSGKVAFIADEETGGFDLRTPRSMLVDLGTEYAVHVRSDADEIHVFDGEVWRTAAEDSDATDFLRAGQARRYDDQSAPTGRELPLVDHADFAWNVPHSDLSEPDAETLVTETFEYSTDTRLTSGGAGGTGWKGPWRGRAWSLDNKPIDDSGFVLPTSLLFEKTPPQGGSVEASGDYAISRQLKEPIRMDRDATYYLGLSVLIREPGGENLDTLFLNLTVNAESDSVRLVNIFRSDGKWATRLETSSVQRVKFDPATPTRWIIKIIARRDEPDQVMFFAAQTLDELANEPTRWHLLGQPVASNAVFSFLRLRVISADGIQFDDLRIGRDWSTVAR